MFKKLVLFIVLALALAGSVSAATYYWDNNADDGLWVTTDNWTDNRDDHSGGQVPTSSDTAYVYGTANLINEANCVIESGDNAVCTTLKIGQYSTGARLDVLGTGTLDNVGYAIWIGKSVSGGSQGSWLTVDGGTIDCSDLFIGAASGGVSVGYGGIIMKSGTININSEFKPGTYGSEPASVVGEVYIYGGTINVDTLVLHGGGHIYIDSGSLVLDSNVVSTCQDHVV